MLKQIIKKTFRVPVTTNSPGKGSTLARQLDVALMGNGFKLSGQLLEYLSDLHPSSVKGIAKYILDAAKELVGGHVKHNSYFKSFPNNIPDTEQFWLECIINALYTPESAAKVSFQLETGVVNLLDLPTYGRYQHTYEEMLEAHEQLIDSAKNKIKVLHLGKELAEETVALYHSLAGSRIPLNEEDRALLAELAECCIDDEQPEQIPIRENKAIVNKIRIENAHAILADTPTDVLRLASYLSGNDSTLDTKPRFISFPKKTRRVLLAALNQIVDENPAKLEEVVRYSGYWKRLGEFLHPREYANRYDKAQDIFAIARGDKRVKTHAAKVELAFINNEIAKAVKLLEQKPGVFIRSLDRILRSGKAPIVLGNSLTSSIERVSTRVILSVREHLANRIKGNVSKRIFANSKGTAWTVAEDREPLPKIATKKVIDILDKEIVRRMPVHKHLVVDEKVLNLAIPLSDKAKSTGFNILPRGSLMPAPEEILRFFIYWKQKQHRTDFDLSAIALDENFNSCFHLSYTHLSHGEHVHSGDITEAPRGASEFIDVKLPSLSAQCKYIVPQIYVYSGEGFDEVEESFFGYMARTQAEMGRPFEAKTVQAKSDLRGPNKVAIPLIFVKNEDGSWEAKWAHLFIKGHARFNRVEENKDTVGSFVQAIVEKEYLKVGYLFDLAASAKAEKYSKYQKGKVYEEPITFVGIEAPENLPEGSKIITLSNLHEFLPEE